MSRALAATALDLHKPHLERIASFTGFNVGTVSISRLAAFVGKHPGMRIEQINKQLGTTTKDLALPIRKLIADGSIKTKGAKRSTA